MTDYERQIKRAERIKTTLYAEMPITCVALDMFIDKCRAAIAAREACDRAWETYQHTLALKSQPEKAAILREARR